MALKRRDRNDTILTISMKKRMNGDVAEDAWEQVGLGIRNSVVVAGADGVEVVEDIHKRGIASLGESLALADGLDLGCLD